MIEVEKFRPERKEEKGGTTMEEVDVEKIVEKIGPPPYTFVEGGVVVERTEDPLKALEILRERAQEKMEKGREQE